MLRSILIAALTMSAMPALSQGINFGDDSSEWAQDGACDDRRFFGPGMEPFGVSWTHVGQDASDCRAAFEAGQVQLWDFQQSRAATQCAAIDFGNDGGEYPMDGECDDLRFEGLGMANQVSNLNIEADASDCSRLCAFGVIGLRNY
jgi:hypothetical protein